MKDVFLARQTLVEHVDQPQLACRTLLPLSGAHFAAHHLLQLHSVNWPCTTMFNEDQIHVYQQALPQTVMAMTARDANALSLCENFWISKERILAEPTACSTPAELAVCLLHQQHVGKLLPPTWQGAEYWVQVYQPGCGLGFHYDKDEQLFKSTGQMVHPIWSSVLYLTGNTAPARCQRCSGSCKQHNRRQQECMEQGNSTDLADGWDGCRQGPTVILDQLFDGDQGPVPDCPSSSAFVWPVRSQYCLFDGRLGHGVLDSSSSSRRATLLINWWGHQPQSVHALEDVMIETLHLTRLSSIDIQQAVITVPSSSSSSSSSTGGESACSSSSLAVNRMAAAKSSDDSALAAAMEVADCAAAVECTTTNSSSSSTTTSSSSKAAAASRPTFSIAAVGCSAMLLPVTAAAAAASSGGNVSSSSSSKVRLLHCQVAAGDTAGDAGVQLVDAVLAKHKLPLAGPDAVSAVVFEHQDFVLYPIEPQDAQAAVEQLTNQAVAASCTTLQTLAAFVSEQSLSEELSS